MSQANETIDFSKRKDNSDIIAYLLEKHFPESKAPLIDTLRSIDFGRMGEV